MCSSHWYCSINASQWTYTSQSVRSSRKGGNRGVQQLGAQALLEVRQRIGAAARILLVDEVSMVDAKLFEIVENRLRQVLDVNRKFGGIWLAFDWRLFPTAANWHKSIQGRTQYEKFCW